MVTNSKSTFNLRTLYALFSLLLLQNVFAQSIVSPVVSGQITTAANPSLEASGFHRFLFGSLWRDIWTTPVDIKSVNSNAPDGSIFFDKAIIRQQENTTIHSLLYKDKNGNEYIFTPINQDSVSSLPIELSEILPKDIVSDQMGILNPFTPLVTSSILKAVGIPYRETQLVSITGNQVLSKEPNIGILEGQLIIPIYNMSTGLDNLIETSPMIESLESNLHNRVDEMQYLKARLIDILLGDWEREADQWQWLSTKTNNQIVWQPIPLNHRQAFVRINGLLPIVADLAIPQLENCSDNISSVENLTLTGRFLDRRLLISFPKQTWDSLATWIQNRLSDSILTVAISFLPAPILEKEGESLLLLLKSRQAQLARATQEFYKLYSSYVDINGTNQAEQVKIRRIGRHMVSVELSDLSDTSFTPSYKRLFHDDFTKEIRILLHGGNDIVNIDGEENSAIKIIVDCGEGQNEFIDKSKSRSLFSSVNPFSAGGTIYYDSNPESKIKAGSNTLVIRNAPQDIFSETEKIRNWGSEWSFSPWLDINPDDGLFIGGGPVYTEYAYRTYPYSKQIGMRAGLATRTMRYRLDATGEFRDWFRGVRTIFQLHASQLDLSNFFGFGNETGYNQTLDNAGYYKVDQKQIFLRTALDFSITDNITSAIGGTIKLIDSKPKTATLLHLLSPDYYNRSLTFLNINARIKLDSRDNESLPTKGIFANVDGAYIPEMLDNIHSFVKFKGEVRTYLTLQNLESSILALRIAGQKIWGEYPFFESAFLGGNESLRGFERQRFAGDASLMGSVELRSRLTHIPFIVPLWAGISAFVETGRVFLSGEHSNYWHNVIGGGVWFSFIKSEYIANFSLARSGDKFAFYATMGFMF
jgi:hypothetical protein